MHRLNLIEGIPGSGKTTMSKLLYEALKSEGIKVEHFSEGDVHPADLSWQSILEVDTFEKLLLKYEAYKEILLKHSLIENGLVFTAYTQLGLEQNTDLYQYLKDHEIYSIGADQETFKEAHLTRWQHFVRHANPETVYIFECVLLQNHVTQLILEYEASEEDIKAYLDDFIKVIHDLSPIIHYLSPKSVNEAIRHVAKERRPEHQDRQNVWIDRVVDDVSKTPYGRRHGLNDIEGFIQFTSHRQSIEKRLLKKLSVECNCIEHSGMDWKEVFNSIKTLS